MLLYAMQYFLQIAVVLFWGGGILVIVLTKCRCMRIAFVCRALPISTARNTSHYEKKNINLESSTSTDIQTYRQHHHTKKKSRNTPCKLNARAKKAEKKNTNNAHFPLGNSPEYIFLFYKKNAYIKIKIKTPHLLVLERSPELIQNLPHQGPSLLSPSSSSYLRPCPLPLPLPSSFPPLLRPCKLPRC